MNSNIKNQGFEDNDVFIYTSQTQSSRIKPTLSLDEIDKIAEAAHFGQKDKLGVDYIEHPRAVARLVEAVPSYSSLSLGEKWQAIAAALLHDVLEDTPIKSADLYNVGLPMEVLYIIKDLTRRPDVSSEDYYSNIFYRNTSRIVKIADLAHNSDEERLSGLDLETASRLRKKYSKAIMRMVLNDNKPEVSYSEDLEWFKTQTKLVIL